MNDVKNFVLPISLAASALVVGIVLGATFSSPKVGTQIVSIPASPKGRLADTAATGKVAQNSTTTTTTDADEPETKASSSTDLIAQLKAALGRPGSRRTYATFSKLADSIDAKNVKEVMAFAESLQKPQEKSMLLSLVVGRWAEFDPQAAIAYAQNLPPGTSRNWALTSAVAGWAERDTNAATTWVQQLPPGPARDQAMQTIVSALAEKNPQAALDFLDTLPLGATAKASTGPSSASGPRTIPSQPRNARASCPPGRAAMPPFR